MNLVKFQVSSWKPKILHFGGFLLSKSYKFSAKKVQKSYFYWHWRMMQILRKNWLVVPNMTWEILRIFTQTLKSLKISFWWAIFLQKYRWVIFYDTEQWYKVSAKKFHKNYVSWHWSVMQNIKKNWLVAWKITKGIWLIFM